MLHLKQIVETNTFSEINQMLQTKDPRLMTAEELEEYADEFQSQMSSGLYDVCAFHFYEFLLTISRPTKLTSRRPNSSHYQLPLSISF